MSQYCKSTTTRSTNCVLVVLFSNCSYKSAIYDLVQEVKTVTVNSEIFARIYFSQIALKDIFAMRKNRDWGMIYLYQ